MRFYCYGVICFLASFFLAAQELTSQRIWKIGTEKGNGPYFEQGIFYSPQRAGHQQLTAVRHSPHSLLQDYERVVFDFNSQNTPRIFGYLSNSENKIYLDFFNASMATSFRHPQNIQNIQNIDFFPFEMLSVELDLTGRANVEIFTLGNPGRLVIDFQK